MKIEEMESKTETNEMNPSKVVSRDEWLVARKDLLTREKELTRLRDEVSRHRRELPWVKIDKKYVFDGQDGRKTLADLFDGRSQLIVYHFMLGPGWEEGCKSCSYLADHFDGANWHLPHRDVTFVVVSRAPLSEIEPFKKRMGWRFKWFSSHGNDFNFDYHVSFTKEEEAKDKAYYNYRMGEFMMDELPGLIADLVGQHLDPFAAAQLGVYLHGRAGDLARDAWGEVGLMASDLLNHLPAAFRRQPASKNRGCRHNKRLSQVL